MDCDDASAESGAPGASVPEMTAAVRTVESVQGPEWVKVPWQAGSLHFPRQPTGSSQHVVGTGAQDCLHPAQEDPSPRPKKPRKRSSGYRANNNTHDLPERQARRRANKLILTGQAPQEPEDSGL